MKSSFHPRLINGPFDDPGLFVPFLFEKRALLFDLGEIDALSPRDVLKISHIFISHTHMDHFIGFDKLLRLFIGRGKPIFLYGPEGIIKNIEGRLSGYTWNLVEHYLEEFVIHVHEVGMDTLLTQKYRCQKRFEPESDVVQEPIINSKWPKVLLNEPSFNISAVILDHAIPCLGFALQERFHINIIKEVLFEMGYSVGPWLGNFKKAVYAGNAPDSLLEVTLASHDRKKVLPLGKLTEKIAKITTGQKIVYITDVEYNAQNEEKIIDIAWQADLLFIEAVFLDQDRNSAAEKKHLTAFQAGKIAALAQVKQFHLFHFSPRYTGMENRLYQEALKAYDEYSI